MSDPYTEICNSLIKSIYNNFDKKAINYKRLVFEVMLGMLSVYDAQTKRTNPQSGDIAMDLTQTICTKLQEEGYFT